MLSVDQLFCERLALAIINYTYCEDTANIETDSLREYIDGNCQLIIRGSVVLF